MVAAAARALLAALLPAAALGALLRGSFYLSDSCAGSTVSSFAYLGEATQLCRQYAFGSGQSGGVKITCVGSDVVDLAVYDAEVTCDGDPNDTEEDVQVGACNAFQLSGYAMSVRMERIDCDEDGRQDSSDPCFARDTTRACVVDSTATRPEDAYAQCFETPSAPPGVAAGRRVLMSELKAGDLVLTDGPSITRVVVNQHVKPAGGALTSEILTLRHSGGEIAVTADHVLLIDGAFAPARTARKGSILSGGAEVVHISHHSGAVVNPITASGTIFASGVHGAPVVAGTGREWLMHVMLSGYPQYTLSVTLARLFPEAAQAYYDDVLEPFFAAAVPHLRLLKAQAPSPLVALGVVVGDFSLTAGLALYSLASPMGVALVAAALGAVAVRVRASRK